MSEIDTSRLGKLPEREWIQTDKGWMSVDRVLGYITPGTAAMKAEEAKRQATGDI